MDNVQNQPPLISAIDLFCGAGGLSMGLKTAGVEVVAGIDLDPACKHPYEANIMAEFIEKDVSKLTSEELDSLWTSGSPRLLAGCAPCQPFSSHRRGADTTKESNWDLLSHFKRLVSETLPEFVTMENVTRLARQTVFQEFVTELRNLNYTVEYGNLYGPEFGLPQERRRLVLVASRVTDINLPVGSISKAEYPTVNGTIGKLPRLEHGQQDPNDSMHVARKLSDLNIARMRASVPGGTWRDWPEELRAECHRRSSGSSFQAFYGRMRGDRPSPTITTQAYNFGTGRFGHPSQDRSLTLREAAMLQGFPRNYQFVPTGQRPTMQTVGKLIGNAVPPVFGVAVGQEFMQSLARFETRVK
ncbi:MULTISPECIES: DNA cytosine methyltransferase [Brevibacterium]|uniref:DNA (cytosine-5-)-methyltransferase n=1 Tax=Brevibacterium casei TaxID=33889 RepID=A0A7T3ZYA9_9MICO|nr:DNA cytosine methyltransferase [Brevibacterium casei]QQB13922.1 DNA cytosine methyltransferase [Brevibacterium casei]